MCATVHLGNSSQVSDGAGAVLLMRRDVAIRKGFPILGVFRFDYIKFVFFPVLSPYNFSYACPTHPFFLFFSLISLILNHS